MLSAPRPSLECTYHRHLGDLERPWLQLLDRQQRSPRLGCVKDSSPDHVVEVIVLNMAPHQNTFTVISNGAPRGGAPSKPPMTSKQAQKLYKKANKAPRLSKAEQRKWEKERQEEIRKELEKERAAVKAKAARERKKAKEEEARENRRLAGQPLIDCRPSQDTIARFVRGNGTSKKRDSSGEPVSESDDSNAARPDTKPRPPAPVAKTDPPASSSHSAAFQERKPAAASMMPPPPRPSQAPQLPTSPSSRTSQRKPLQDGTIPPPPLPKAVSAAQALRAPPILKLPVITPIQHRPAASVVAGPPLKPRSRSRPKPFMMPKVILPNLSAGRQQPFKQEGLRKMPADRKLADLKQADQEQQPSRQLQTEQKQVHQDTVKQETVKSESIELEIPTRQKCVEQKHTDQKLPGQRVVDERSSEEKSPVRKQSQQMQPGQDQPQKKLSQSQKQSLGQPPVRQSQRPPPRQSHQMAPIAPRCLSVRDPVAQLEPPSTQAILQGRFDDFFPTASQLALELEDDEFEDGSQRRAQKPLMGPVKDIPSAPSECLSGKLNLEKAAVLNEAVQGPAQPHKKQNLEASHEIKPIKQPPGHSTGGRHAVMHTRGITTVQQPTLGQRGPGQDIFGHPHRPNERKLPAHSRLFPVPPKPVPMSTRHTAQAFQQRRPPIDGRLNTLHGIAVHKTSKNHAPASRPTAAAKSSPLGDFFSLVCTQDLMMSSQEVLEIESPAKLDSQPSSAGVTSHPSPSVELDLATIDWDDDLDDF